MRKHLSAHMFFEKPEVKKALYALVKQFAFKNQSESKKLQDYTQYFQEKIMTV